MKNRVVELTKMVREKSPLVHNITNYVVMNNSANALLSIGASPIMSHALEEIEEMVSICSALVLNVGTLDRFSVEAMLLAQKKANEIGKPVVLDPVGAGATSYRNQVLSQLVNDLAKVDFIRGNGSEIAALSGVAITSRGVDSTVKSTAIVDVARELSIKTGAVVCVSGATDVVVFGDKVCFIANGSPLMEKVTGLGCSATAILGAFAALGEDKFESAVAATSLIAICGEIAASKCEGPGTLQLHLLDKLYNITENEILSLIKLK